MTLNAAQQQFYLCDIKIDNRFDDKTTKIYSFFFQESIHNFSAKITYWYTYIMFVCIFPPPSYTASSLKPAVVSCVALTPSSRLLGFTHHTFVEWILPLGQRWEEISIAVWKVQAPNK